MKLQAPKSQAGLFVFFFLTEFVSSFVIVANTRAFTEGSYLWTAITDTFFASQCWIVGLIFARFSMDKGAEGKGVWAGAGYVIGATGGSLFSIFITKLLYGK